MLRDKAMEVGDRSSAEEEEDATTLALLPLRAALRAEPMGALVELRQLLLVLLLLLKLLLPWCMGIDPVVLWKDFSYSLALSLKVQPDLYRVDMVAEKSTEGVAQVVMRFEVLRETLLLADAVHTTIASRNKIEYVSRGRLYKRLAN
jgi:hypothetical protein